MGCGTNNNNNNKHSVVKYNPVKAAECPPPDNTFASLEVVEPYNPLIKELKDCDYVVGFCLSDKLAMMWG